MNLFYVPNAENASSVHLDEQESRHCAMVLRLGEADKIHLTDGKGNLFEAIIEKIKKKDVKVRIHSKEAIPNHYHLHLAIAPTKQIDRLEWFVEKATEIGVSAITPIFCYHSERRAVRTDRLEKVAVSAMKQSLKAHKPIINAPVKFQDFMSKVTEPEKYIAHCRYKVQNQLVEQITESGKYLVLIGPEGDFSDEEVNNALGAGFKEISLGKSRLRTETAGIVVCHSVALKQPSFHHF